MASLPYKAEYAKSGRASCKICKSNIEKGVLRLAVLVPSRFHDGKDTHWFHKDCFFTKHRPPSVGDIEDFESLRYDDQQLIKSKLSGAAVTTAGPSGKGKGKKGAPTAGIFSAEYAKSGRSECGACSERIPDKALRISKKDFTSEKALLYGGANGLDKWHHVDCFVKIRDELEFFVAADKNSLRGFKDLEKEDQALLKKRLPAMAPTKRKIDESSGNGESNGAGPSKKIKTEKGVGSSDEAAIEKQNKQLYKNRDACEAVLKKDELLQILRANKQEVPSGLKLILDLVADIMTFGAMERCSECKTGQFMYKSGVGYQCTGYLTEFTRCNYVMDGDVKRKPFKVPNDLREYAAFAGKSFKVAKRVIPKHVAPVKGKMLAEAAEGPKIVKKPLKGFKFVIVEVGGDKKESLASTIKKYGGETREKCSATIAAVIMPKKKYDDSNTHVAKAKKYGVPVVSSEFVENVDEVRYKLVDQLSKYVLSDWVKDIRARLKTLNEEFEKAPEEEKRGQVKLKMKDGAVIDPLSGLDDGPYHIYREGKLYYNCVLNRTDVDEGCNSFYKIQIIESDDSPKTYHVFRHWGRIGTTSGGHQTDEKDTIEEAIDLFTEKYFEKSGNVWGQKFVRKPGKYVNVDIDYGQGEEYQKLVPSTATSKLPLAVQSLISLIFDVDIMKKTLLEFEIDMDKMPLGKISRKQLLEAYSVLTDSMNLMGKETDERKRDRLIADVSNRFYTLIPHNFGSQLPPRLDNDELVKTKIEMLDNLMEIEIAYELLAQGEEQEGGRSIDSHYKKLSADIDIVEAHSEEFKILSKYLSNTHAPTHSNYELEIDQAFKVVRKGENKRYRPFKDLHNRKLLWHGSRISNFAGIISQGLRIAPPEAPVTGYMFGKGIYFADMVTKSANYCHTSRDNPTGLLLLCEVALGDMHELKQAKDSLTKPPKKAHSVKGLGQTEPDPKDTYTFPDGVMVPYGKPAQSKARDSALLYNEYIVYDVAQVNVKYLLKVNFNYGGKRRK